MESKQSDLAEIQDFFRRYRGITQDLSKDRVHRFQTEFIRLKNELEPLLDRRKENERKWAPFFNVFRVLRLEGKEVITHSAILAELLDPDGRPSQGFLFLREFFKEAQNIKLALPSVEDQTKRWIVEREKVTEKGNLDIVIKCPALQYMLVIENKIYAGEQGSQLQRYSEWMQEQKSYKDRQLIYLTPDGRKADTAGEYPYFRMSYCENIRKFLINCLREVKAPKLTETLGQYLETVENL